VDGVSMFDAATLAAERVQAPDPEVPVVSHVYLQGVKEVTVTGAALPSTEVRHVNLRGLAQCHSLDIDGSSARP